jgi:hypothetical protein
MRAIEPECEVESPGLCPLDMGEVGPDLWMAKAKPTVGKDSYYLFLTEPALGGPVHRSA